MYMGVYALAHTLPHTHISAYMSSLQIANTCVQTNYISEFISVCSLEAAVVPNSSTTSLVISFNVVTFINFGHITTVITVHHCCTIVSRCVRVHLSHFLAPHSAWCWLTQLRLIIAATLSLFRLPQWKSSSWLVYCTRHWVSNRLRKKKVLKKGEFRVKLPFKGAAVVQG